MSNTCKYWDCGWCYAPDNVGTNADSQSACVNPSFCPYLVRDEAMHPTTQEDLEDVQLVLERMNSIPEPITLEELMTLDDTTQEDS